MKVIEILGKSLYVVFGRLVLPFAIGGSRRSRVVVINKANNKVLLVRSLISSQRWHFPGGGIHPNEKAAQGAIRELREEVSIELEAKQLRFIKEQQEADKSAKFISFYYEAKVHNPALKPRRFEIIETGWFRVSELPANTEPSVGQVLDFVSKMHQ